MGSRNVLILLINNNLFTMMSMFRDFLIILSKQNYLDLVGKVGIVTIKQDYFVFG